MRPLLRRSRRFREIRSRNCRRSKNPIIDKPGGSVEFRIKFFDAESIRVVGVGYGYEDSVADDGLDERRRNVSWLVDGDWWGWFFFFSLLLQEEGRRKNSQYRLIR